MKWAAFCSNKRFDKKWSFLLGSFLLNISTAEFNGVVVSEREYSTAQRMLCTRLWYIYVYTHLPRIIPILSASSILNERRRLILERMHFVLKCIISFCSIYIDIYQFVQNTCCFGFHCARLEHCWQPCVCLSYDRDWCNNIVSRSFVIQ